ncbi:MAG: hypothetical protein KKI02_09135 [Planctomycetes bacterium]|nr:hypothetical protein [Planctomycetota bacterium]
MKNRYPIAGILLLAALIVAPAAAQQKQGKSASATSGAQADKLKPQTVCPIMGGKINKEVFVDAAGYRFYACCPACLDKIKADPEQAVAALKAKGEKPELRLVVCPKCGEIKGDAQCCKPNAPKCPKCGLNKASIGCCKDLKPAAGKSGIAICSACGDVKGSNRCCN